MIDDVYVWKSPRNLDDEQAAALVAGWLEAGGEPAASPFEPSTDVGWFHRELMADGPALTVTTDAVHTPTRTPIWLSGTDEPAARVVGVRLTQGSTRNDLDSLVSLAAKYDLVLFDARRGRVHRPLDAMAAHASATFWPSGAIRAALAGGVGSLLAVGAWVAEIPVISGVLVVVGAFLFVMAMYTLVHEGRNALRTRRADQEPPGTG